MPDDRAKTEEKADDRVTLRAGRAELELSLDGGCITAFRWHGSAGAIDWMRPAPAGSGFPPTDTACFPLVPYSNRIRDGRFDFEGRLYQLPLNFPPESHAIHGHGWQGRWQVEARGEASATLVFENSDSATRGEWPAAYRAEQRFELSEDDLLVEIAVSNEGDQSMPVGLGLHPYFPRTPECRLTAEVGRMWENDDEVMPTLMVTPPPEKDPNHGVLPSSAGIDNCFAGFGGKAVIEWPEWRAKMTIYSGASLGFLVVFTPPGENFFCVEPVSAMTDAVNLAQEGRGDTGFRSLAPGERFAAKLRFAPALETA
ncbi:aldose 1-epimerase [Pelagibius litoralis]|uniref:Aldose 1-epimerase n=1 Tax=Pelagibius litoralis TaxID=374515 RepID=A0A967EXC4_9PROT|nr:aldose 1-epimerase [Pelagibius litoralis]NIA68825.1 aldose 1-epimerase [Pelagibius litoralis]